MNNETDWALVAQKLHQDYRQLENKLNAITQERDELRKSHAIATQNWLETERKLKNLVNLLQKAHEQIHKN